MIEEFSFKAFPPNIERVYNYGVHVASIVKVVEQCHIRLRHVPLYNTAFSLILPIETSQDDARAVAVNLLRLGFGTKVPPPAPLDRCAGVPVLTDYNV